MSEPAHNSLSLQNATQIWRAGVAAVDPEKLIQKSLRFEGSTFIVMALNAVGVTQELRFDGQKLGKILVVGAGKAGATMAEAVEHCFLDDISTSELWRTRLSGGWVNVPADCVRTLRRIQLYAARPAGVNEPRMGGVVGTREILRRVSELTPQDLCICLISGGGSALLPAPIEGISLEEKIAVTRFLSAAGANIAQLNAVRTQLSAIKGGGLARGCRAPLVSLILSDVLGDPLDVIASGPTVLPENVPDHRHHLSDHPKQPSTHQITQPPSSNGSAQEALEILRLFHADAPHSGVSANLWRVLESKAAVEKSVHTLDTSHHTLIDDEKSTQSSLCPPIHTSAQLAHGPIWNLVLGNNRTAVTAAANEARQLGYEVVLAESAEQCEGNVHDVATSLVDRMLVQIEEQTITGATQRPLAFISGGEPVVQLADAAIRGKGGRNTQLVLDAITHLYHLSQLYQHSFPEAPSQPSSPEDSAKVTSHHHVASHETSHNTEAMRKRLAQMVILSGGTDGEDGPTNAAGAVGSLATFIQAEPQTDAHANNGQVSHQRTSNHSHSNAKNGEESIVQQALRAIQRNDSWTFFHRFGGLIQTGPTGTNVCDLRVVLFDPTIAPEHPTQLEP